MATFSRYMVCHVLTWPNAHNHSRKMFGPTPIEKTLLAIASEGAKIHNLPIKTVHEQFKKRFSSSKMQGVSDPPLTRVDNAVLM